MPPPTPTKPRLKVGFLVNPIAGMGGTVALKGTDGLAAKAHELGAEPSAPQRAREFLARLEPRDVSLVSAPAPMGGLEARAWSPGAEVLPMKVPLSAYETTVAHTREACVRFLEAGVSLVVFVGGDGTACDVAKAVERKVPILGVPSGVKMYSGVFAHTPNVAGHVVNRIAERGKFRDDEAEIMDIDEALFRRGELGVKLCSVARVPREEGVQAGKSPTEPEEDELAALVEGLARGFPLLTLLLIGGGTTTHALKERLAKGGTLLGVDAFRRDKNGWHLLAADCGEAKLLDLLSQHHGPSRIVLSPLGSAGFVLGRGTAPLSPVVVRGVGVDNVIVIATPGKLRGLDALHLDTGDETLNRLFSTYLRVVTGPDREKLVPVGVVTK